MTLPQPLLAWWNARESREQKLLLVGAVFAVAAGLYAVVQPMISTHRVASETFQFADADYHWLKGQIAALARMRTQAGGALLVNLPPQAMKEKLESDLQKKSLKGKVAIEENANMQYIKVTLDSGDGRAVMRWIEELTNDGYAVFGLDFKNQGGRLSGTVTIEG